MELKPGYTQTEVGVIPADWTVRPVRDVCKLINGRGFKPYEWKTTGLPIIRIQNLNGSDDFNYFSGAYDKKLEVEPGQLLFAWSGSRGSSFGPHIWRGPLGVLNYHTWKVQIREAETNKSFLAHLFRQLTSTIEGKAHGASALVHTQKWEMEGYLLPVPTKAEQAAIAQALSDADALIEALDQLIAKKRQIKQGAMQELLTGKRRLPGFSGEWVVRPLASVVADLEAGVSVNSIEITDPFSTAEPCILKTSAIFDGNFNPAECKLIDHRDTSRARLSPRRDSIIISRMNTPNLVGEVGYVAEDFPSLYLPDRLWMTRFVNGADVSVRWLSYVLSSPLNKESIKGLATGTSGSMKNISKSAFLSLHIAFPSESEQTAIANILSDMDTEIAALQSQLAKARQIKQGMMQELLTGRIRLL